VPRVIRAFREASPLVSLALDEDGTTQLIQNLREDRVDVAFIRTPVADPAGLVVDPLLEEKMVVALPEQHILAAREHGDETGLDLKRLAGETFIVYRRHSVRGFMMRSSRRAMRRASVRWLVRKRRGSFRHSISSPPGLDCRWFRRPCSGCIWTV